MIDSLGWYVAFPEILLLVMACVIALVDLGVKTPMRGVTHLLTMLTLAVLAVFLGVYASSGATVVAFGGSFSGAIIGLLYGASYATSGPVFAWCLFACGLGTVTQGATSLLVSADRQHTILILTVALGLLKVALDILLIARFGLYGSVAAIVIELLVIAASYLTIGIRVSGVQLEWLRLLRIILAAALAAAAAALVHTLHLVPWLTLLLGGTVLSAVYFALTLLMQCWSRADIEQFQGLHQKFASGRPLLFGRLLNWAGARAATGEP